jgi:hypothetical protein
LGFNSESGVDLVEGVPGLLAISMLDVRNLLAAKKPSGFTDLGTSGHRDALVPDLAVPPVASTRLLALSKALVGKERTRSAAV